MIAVRCADSALLLPTFREVWGRMPADGEHTKRLCYQCSQHIQPGQAIVQWFDGNRHLVMQEHVRCP